MKRVKNIKNSMIKNKKGTNKFMVNNASSDENDIKTFIIITIVLVVLIGAVYFVTELLSKESTKDEEVSTQINYDKIAVGNMLNAPYDDYYVLIYNADDTKAIMYSNLLSTYMRNKGTEGYLKIYFCDLSNKLNSAYYNVNNDNKSNPKAAKVSELDLSDLTLIRVTKGSIKSYIESYDEIKKVLS